MNYHDAKKRAQGLFAVRNLVISWLLTLCPYCGYDLQYWEVLRVMVESLKRGSQTEREDKAV